VAFGVVMAWFRLKFGSLWRAVLPHAAHNVWMRDRLPAPEVNPLWPSAISPLQG
jgi:membrane protease YdiL (CAAX protease family)